MPTLLQKWACRKQQLIVGRWLAQSPAKTRDATQHWKWQASQLQFRQRSSGAAPSWKWCRERRVLSRDPAVLDTFKLLPVCVNFKSNFSKNTSKIEKQGGTINSDSSKMTAERDKESPTLHRSIPENFEDYRVAYRDKSVTELLGVLGFFFLCRFSLVTDNAVKIMALSYRVLGKRLAELLIRKAAYDQFVAGEGLQELQRLAARLRRGGVASILCVPIETDEEAVNCLATREQYLDDKLEMALGSIQMCTKLGDDFPMTQFRISAFFAGDLMKTVSKLCEQTTHDAQVLQALTQAMFGHSVDFCQLPGWGSFPQDRNNEFSRGLRRLGKIKDAMEGRDVIALIDAEYSSINPALRLLCLCLMKACNTEYAKVFYTYQAYLKRTRSQLQQDLAFASANNFGFGLKLVRGAYMVTERQIAQELRYEVDLFESFEHTSASYHDCVDLLLGQVAMRLPRSVRFMVASHNEDSMKYVTTRMADLGIPNNGPSVFFGQLYGMADHVSFTLGHHGYRVHKSVPFGPVMETLPYLSRRAQENKAILVNARRERKLVFRALVDRLTFNSLPPRKFSQSSVNSFRK